MKDKNTAGVLALILGGIGVHRFYLGQFMLGLLYLVFCWTFIPMFVSFLDMIVFFAQDKATFDKKYNTPDFSDPIADRYKKTVSPNAQASNSADALDKLFTLKEKGAITAQEFEDQKKKLLA